MENRGQVTIFVIVGLLIAGAIILVFILAQNRISRSSVEENPGLYIRECVEDAVEESVEKLYEGGGLINATLNRMYQGENYTYLCYQGDYYFTCYNPYPMLEMLSERDIVTDSEAIVEGCFDSAISELEDLGYSVSTDEMNYSVDLLPGVVDIHLRKKILATKEGLSISYDNFDSSIISPIYSLVKIAREIVNQESQFCNFDYNGFMLLYPKYSIRRIGYADSRVYQIEDRASGKILKFMVRSCVIPGLG